jgi:alkenylglycerophosphocholine hydrolase
VLILQPQVGMQKDNIVKIIKTVVSVVLSCIYFIYPCVYTKFPPVLWDAYACNRDKYGLAISMGLVFGAIGDITIDYSFIAGLGFFLIDHLIDIYAFALSKPTISYICIAFSICYLAVMMYALVPYVQSDMVIPVILYAIALIFSACIAGMRCISGQFVSTHSRYYAFVGASVFVISDTLLAFKIFRISEYGAVMANSVMITYYVAQLFLAISSYIDTPIEEDIYCSTGTDQNKLLDVCKQDKDENTVPLLRGEI